MEEETAVKQGRIESFMDLVEDVKKEKDHEYISSQISKHFSQKLFDLVTEISQRKQIEEQVEVLSQDDDIEEEQEEEAEGEE